MFTLDTLFLGRMGNAQSRTRGMNYPLQVYISFSGRAQELGWSSVSCRKQLQQWADFSALYPFSLLHYSPEVYFWCEKCSSLVGMSSFSSLPLCPVSPQWEMLDPNEWCQSSTPLGGIIRVQLGKKTCTLGSLQHSSPKKNPVGADFPDLLSVLQNFLVLLKMWSSLDLDFYSIFILLPGEFCGVWS